MNLTGNRNTLQGFEDGLFSERLYEVVNAYESALLASYPRARYVVGLDARCLWIPTGSWMPEWLSDYLLAHQNNRPVPQAVTEKKYE